MCKCVSACVCILCPRYTATPRPSVLEETRAVGGWSCSRMSRRHFRATIAREETAALKLMWNVLILSRWLTSRANIWLPDAGFPLETMEINIVNSKSEEVLRLLCIWPAAIWKKKAEMNRLNCRRTALIKKKSLFQTYWVTGFHRSCYLLLCPSSPAAAAAGFTAERELQFYYLAVLVCSVGVWVRRLDAPPCRRHHWWPFCLFAAQSGGDTDGCNIFFPFR